MSERGTIAGRDAFMQHVANRLGRPAPLVIPPAHPNRGVPEAYTAIKQTQDEKVLQFMHNWQALNGKVLVVKEAEASKAIGAYLKEVTAELEVSRIVRWEHESLLALQLDEGLREAGIELVAWREQELDTAVTDEKPSNWTKRSSLLRAAEKCQMGIVFPDYAISNTSTLALLAHGGRGRSVSLLPSILFAIFRADQIVTRMGEVFAEVRENYPQSEHMPSSINLITGPSRSADIENDLTIGIHGPGKVYAVIIE